MLQQKRLVLCVSDYRQALTKVLSKVCAEASKVSPTSKCRLAQITLVNQTYNHNTESQMGSSKLRIPQQSCSTGKGAWEIHQCFRVPLWKDACLTFRKKGDNWDFYYITLAKEKDTSCCISKEFVRLGPIMSNNHASLFNPKPLQLLRSPSTEHFWNSHLWLPQTYDGLCHLSQ